MHLDKLWIQKERKCVAVSVQQQSRTELNLRPTWLAMSVEQRKRRKNSKTHQELLFLNWKWRQSPRNAPFDVQPRWRECSCTSRKLCPRVSWSKKSQWAAIGSWLHARCIFTRPNPIPGPSSYFCTRPDFQAPHSRIANPSLGLLGRGFPNLTAGFPASCPWQLCRDKTKRPKFPAFVFFCHYNTRVKQLWTF